MDLKLNRPATVRGRLIIEGGRVVGDCEVTAQAADKRENRYYDPTTRVNEDGTFELKFVRSGTQTIRLNSTWSGESSINVDLKEGEVLEGIELHGVADRKSISEQMKNRTFRVTVLNGDGQPVPKQQLWLSSQHRMSLNLEPLAGD